MLRALKFLCQRIGDSVSSKYLMAGALLRPDPPCGLRDEAHVGALRGLGEGIAGGGGGKAALRSEPQPLEIDEFRRLAGAAFKIVDGFQHWRLGADKAQHHALVAGHEAQRLEVARTRRVVLEQEMGDARVREKAPRHRLIAAL